jgi:hypothetical protein
MIASILAPFRQPTQKRLLLVIQEQIQAEKMKLLEAKQAKDFADTDIEYRNKRIASLMLSLKEEQDAQTNIIATDSTDIHNALFGKRPQSSWDITRASVPS